MVFLVALITAVGMATGVPGQWRPTPPDLEVMDPARGVIGDSDDPFLFRYDDLILNGVALFLAGIRLGHRHCRYIGETEHRPACGHPRSQNFKEAS
jgi:hypothetical protein